jgi:hypothetical protein
MGGPDLFGWKEAAEAEARLRELHAARRVAAKRARFAPHGQTIPRQETLRTLTTEELRAALELQRLRDGAPS